MRRRTIALLATPAIVLTIACGTGGVDDTKGPGAAQPASGGAHTIVLDVTGPTAADITYGTGTDQSQDNGAKVPWQKTLSFANLPFATTIVAQSKGNGAINCKITIDGSVVKENTSTGQYAVVTCSTS